MSDGVCHPVSQAFVAVPETVPAREEDLGHEGRGKTNKGRQHMAGHTSRHTASESGEQSEAKRWEGVGDWRARSSSCIGESRVREGLMKLAVDKAAALDLLGDIAHAATHSLPWV